MKTYEVVREIENNCERNQMRDVFFEEIETDDPVGYVRDMIKGKEVDIQVDEPGPGRLNVFVTASGIVQKFLFTEI